MEGEVLLEGEATYIKKTTRFQKRGPDKMILGSYNFSNYVIVTHRTRSHHHGKSFYPLGLEASSVVEWGGEVPETPGLISALPLTYCGA